MLHAVLFAHAESEGIRLRAVIRDLSASQSAPAKPQKLHSHQSVHQSVGEILRRREGERVDKAV